MDSAPDSDLADRLSLLDLMTRYAHAVDDRDIAGVVSCFGADAELSANGGAASVAGRAAITAYFEDAFSRPSLAAGSRSSHLLTNSTVRVKGDQAQVETLGLAVLAQPGSERVVLRGLRYSDRCSRIDGRWLIVERQHRALWQCDAPGGVI